MMAGKIGNCKIKRVCVVAAFVSNAEFKAWARRGKHLYNWLDVLISQRGNQRCHPVAETQIERYEPDRLVVYGIVRLHSNRC